mmetsp:Transcript_5726/g.16984  ORF Transcript_5726/g.16984 Transcript_5726/m.16984 type:complete len:224 (-) Transcript_5726:3211-3882(-)
MVVPGPLNVNLAFQLAGHNFRNIGELAQRRLALPDFARHHVGPIQRELGERGPVSTQRNLKEASHDTGGRLLNECHVCNQSKAVEAEARDVGLQQDVHLGGWLVRAFLHRDWDLACQLGQFQLLLFSDCDVCELSTQAEQSENLDVRHRGPHVAIVHCHGGMGDVELTRNSSERSGMDHATSTIVPDQMTLFQHACCSVDKIHAVLLQRLILPERILGIRDSV